MNPQTYIDLIPKIGRLLSNKNTYYVLFLAVLGFWLWKDEGKINGLETAKKKSDSLNVAEISRLNLKIENKNCVEEFKVWKEALYTDLDTKKQAETQDLALEKKRTEELQQTYELIKQNPIKK
jgi:hypothetical protein